MNKKLLNLIWLVLPVVACTPENGGDEYQPQAPFTLSVDKTVIESDGQQTATFKVIDTNGEVITDYPSLARTSAAICAGFGLAGLAGGAAVAGCCAQMIGFAVMSFKENRWGGLVAQGVGTSMLQMPNIVKNPKIWIPPILASAITGPIATCIFKLQMNGAPVNSGMGTCGFCGQIGIWTGWVADVASGAKEAITTFDWLGMALICFVLPAILSLIFCEILRKIGWIKENDLKLDL